MKTSKAKANPARFSKDVIELNPQLAKGQIASPDRPVVTSESVLGARIPKKGKKRREMNATEREFSLFLDAQMRAGNLLSWEYEGMTLRWGKIEQFKYTPDFVVYESVNYYDPDASKEIASHPHIKITMIEVKGAHAWRQDILRYKMARENYPLFRFEFWQKTNNGWEMTR